jgi:two-component system CheB/CheR fusion protein
MTPDQNNAIVVAMVRLYLEQTQEHACLVLDTSGRIIAWLGCAQKIFGYTSDEVIGQPMSILFTPENVQAGMDIYEIEVAKTNVEAEDDRWMLRKDGSRFWAAGVTTPVKDETGQLLGFVKLMRDRTDLRAQTDALEKRVEALQQLDDTKNRFVSTLAHEVRNPLSTIVTSAQLLKVIGGQNEEIEFAVSTIERATDSMRRLIEDVFDATRARTGKVTLEKRVQPLAPIIESAVEMCRPQIDANTQKLNVLLPAPPILVEVDADRLRQVFINLLQNAAKFTKDGGTIWVKLTLEGRDAVAKVEDNGVGISPEQLPQIFDLFTQAEVGASRYEGGLGIGLSVVKELVALHGGTVQVRSDGVGKGSEFSVRLPVAVIVDHGNTSTETGTNH